MEQLTACDPEGVTTATCAQTGTAAHIEYIESGESVSCAFLTQLQRTKEGRKGPFIGFAAYIASHPLLRHWNRVTMLHDKCGLKAANPAIGSSSRILTCFSGTRIGNAHTGRAISQVPRQSARQMACRRPNAERDGADNQDHPIIACFHQDCNKATIDLGRVDTGWI